MMLSFIAFMVLFTVIGLWSARHATSSTDDYLLASSKVPAWLAGLSAVATNNSGYMFIGMIGYTYAEGLCSVWLMVGWLVGDYAASKLLYEKVRNTTEQRKILSFSGLLSQWQGGEYKRVRQLAGILTIVFLTAYAAAQIKAGSKALHVLMGWEYSTGAILGTGIILAYCLAGGLRASIWTDAAQSFVMLIAMAMLFYTAIDRSGGWGEFNAALHAVDEHYMAWLPREGALGPVLGGVSFIGGWLFGGFGVAGQPHIMVRFMAIESASAVTRARVYYYLWFASFYALTIGVGLATRLFVQSDMLSDMELALPLMAQELLPEVGLGILLAGMFAATMSTADSQILSCSAAVTQDVAPGSGRSLIFTKMVTASLSALALAIALSDNQSVFSLVLMAWAALASAFAPLLVVLSLGGKPSERVSLAMMVTGLIACVVWSQAGLGGMIYEIVPGMIAGFVPYLCRAKKE